MATRDLTRAYLERRDQKRALAEFQRWTEESVDSDDEEPLYGGDGSYGDVERGDAGNKKKKDEAATMPSWVETVKAVEARALAIECELKRVDSLQRRKMLVTFDAASEDGRERELHDAMGIIHENLKLSEQVITDARSPLADSKRTESGASCAARRGARKGLAMRLQELSRRYRIAQRDHARDLRSRTTTAKAIDDDLGFLTNGAERRALESHETRRPGERVLTLEDAEQLEHDSAMETERAAEIEAIAKSVKDVAEIFKELAVLVIDQGTVLDRVDYNMEVVADRVFNATSQLRQADQSSKRAKPLKLVISLLVIIAVLFVLLVKKMS